MVPRLLHKPVANEVGVAFRACPLVTPSDPSVLKIPHTHHHSYAMKVNIMKVKVYIMKVWVWLTERVGVAYS